MSDNYCKKIINSTNSTFFVDITLFCLAIWSGVGYSFFTQSAVSESISDPLEKYLYNSISDNSINNINKFLNVLSQTLSYSDAVLTIATISDVEKKREKSYKEMMKGVYDFYHGDIQVSFFLLNLTMFLYSFVVISLSPWTGLKEKNFSDNFTLPAGITMFGGQMSIFLLQYSNYMFSAPKDISGFFNLSYYDRKNIFYNIFFTKKGLAFVFRSIANMVTMGIRFHGISLFTSKYLFRDDKFSTFYSILASISVVYRVFLTQCLNDYRKTFAQQTIPSEQGELTAVEASRNDDLEAPKNIPIDYSNNFEKVLIAILAILISMTFLLRTLSTPVLYSGPVSDPEKNYNTNDLVFACFGLLMGGFAASQYCKFMWGLGKEAAKNTSIYISDCNFFAKNPYTSIQDQEVAANGECISYNAPQAWPKK